MSRAAQPDDEWQVQTELLGALVKAKLLGPPHRAPQLGRFEIVRGLGHGAAGAVYEARDTRTDAVVALKLLRTREARAVQAFKQEFRGLTHVVHENLVQLHEFFGEGERWYFTMELVRGVSFTDYVSPRTARNARCDLDRLRPALVQLLSAVQAVHAAGRLHSDLKPSNALVTDAGRVVVLDFGLLASSDARAQGSARGAVGTAAYMAPELWQGYASAASDAYALGVMLFECLTGRRPPREGAPARQIPVNIPDDLARICAGWLEQAPNARLTVADALAQLGARAAPARAAAVAPLPELLIGRDVELDWLRAAQRRVRPGRPVAVFVRGRSGVGKSALVGRFAAELRTDATTLLYGRCYASESLPYKAFDGVVDALAEQLATLPHADCKLSARENAALLKVFPALRTWSRTAAADGGELPPSGAEQRQLAFAALKKLLYQLSLQRALVVIVDDLQWADLDSARLLLDLLGPPAAPALLYVGCYRSEEEQRSEFLRTLRLESSGLLRQSEQRLLELRPFETADAMTMALALIGDRVLDPRLAAACIARESGGMPFFVRELARFFVDDLAGDETGVSLTDLLARRVASLRAQERLALELLALASRPVGPELLARASQSQPASPRDLRLLMVQGLVSADADGQLVVYHDRLREQVVEHLPRDRAAALHRALAQAYETAPDAEPEWLIEHWRGAGEPARARAYALTAARSASGKLAFNRAAQLYRVAIELHPARDAEWRELTTAMGEALVNAGRGVEAASAFLASAEGAPDDTAHALRCRAAQQYLRSSREAQGKELLSELFRELGERYPSSSLHVMLQLLTSRGRQALRLPRARKRNANNDVRLQRQLRVLGAAFRELSFSDPLRGMLFQNLFYEKAQQAGDLQSVFIGLAWDTYNRAFLAGARQPRTIANRLDRLDALARQLATPYAHGTALFVRGSTALWREDYALAANRTGQALTIFREQCPGALWEETACSLMHYTAIENVGPLSKLCLEAPAASRRADERGDELAGSIIGGFMASALLLQDQPAQAIEQLTARLARLSSKPDFRTVAVATRLTDAYIYAHDGERAWRTYQAVWPTYLRTGYDRLDSMSMFCRLRLAHAALLANETRRDPALERVVDEAIRKLLALRRRDATAIAEGLRAARAFQHGKLAQARACMRRAVSLLESYGTPIAEHCYRLQLGGLGGPDGSRLMAVSEAALRAEGVVDPWRWSTIYVTGLGRV